MNKIGNVKLNVLIFYFSYTLILMGVMFRQVYGISGLLEKITQISMVLLLVNCVININKINIKKVLILYLVILLATITKIVTGTNTILIMCLLIIGCRNIELKKIIKYDLCIKIPFLVIVCILYFLDLTNVNLHYRNGIVRHSMGFSNPNVFSTFILAIVVEYLYLRDKKINIRDFIIAIGAIFVIDYYADSRTQILSLVAVTILLFVNKNTKKILFNNKIVNFITANIFIILAIASLMLTYSYRQGNEKIYVLNEIASGRIRRMAEISEKYDINLFGNKLELVTSLQAKLTGKEQVALDNVYMYSVLSYGIIPFIGICILARKYMKNTIKEKEDVLRAIMLIFLIAGLMERFCIEVQCNIFLLYFSHILYENKESIKRKEEIEGESEYLGG